MKLVMFVFWLNKECLLGRCCGNVRTSPWKLISWGTWFIYTFPFPIFPLFLGLGQVFLWNVPFFTFPCPYHLICVFLTSPVKLFILFRILIIIGISIFSLHYITHKTSKLCASGSCTMQ